MKLIEQISADFKTALMESKNGESARDKKNFLGVLKTEVTKESREPSDAFIISKIKSMIKSAEATNSFNDMELEVLESYLPKQLTEDEVRTIVRDILIETPNANMGQIMGMLKKGWGGEYDGKMASTIVKESTQ